MTNILSNVKSVLKARRGSNDDDQNTLSPEYSQSQMQSFSSDQVKYDQIPDSYSPSSIDLKPSAEGSESNGKSKKELKAERKAAEQEELSRLAAEAREKGENMRLDPYYVMKDFGDRGLALGGRDFFPTFGKR
ncbi:uncharacterized protein L199_004382 [Kwoniella botswanensis]|uniref:uncharacterized protein n=1 Tax=Kwoniella botswanensis TaxID=1268659 RepID=UPI00315D75B6